MKDHTTLSVEVTRCRAVVDRVESLLERLCRARTFNQAIDLAFEARRELGDLPPRLAAVLLEPKPFIPPDPVAAEYFATHDCRGT